MAYTYNANEVSATWGGIALIDEPGEETMIEVIPDQEDWTKKVGAKGHATRSKTNNLGATIRVHCMQTSPVNQLLSAARNMDIATGNGSGVAPFLLKDRLSNGEVHAAAKAWIKGAPECPYGKEAGERIWELDCEAMVSNHAGH